MKVTAQQKRAADKITRIKGRSESIQRLANGSIKLIYTTVRYHIDKFGKCVAISDMSVSKEFNL